MIKMWKKTNVYIIVGNYMLANRGNQKIEVIDNKRW